MHSLGVDSICRRRPGISAIPRSTISRQNIVAARTAPKKKNFGYKERIKVMKLCGTHIGTELADRHELLRDELPNSHEDIPHPRRCWEPRKNQHARTGMIALADECLFRYERERLAISRVDFDRRDVDFPGRRIDQGAAGGADELIDQRHDACHGRLHSRASGTKSCARSSPTLLPRGDEPPYGAACWHVITQAGPGGKGRRNRNRRLLGGVGCPPTL